MPDGVERAADYPPRVGSDALGEHAGSVDHLPRRPAGEGQQEDRFRRNPLRQQPRDTGAEGRGLAGPGAGKDQQRVAAVTSAAERWSAFSTSSQGSVRLSSNMCSLTLWPRSDGVQASLHSGGAASASCR